MVMRVSQLADILGALSVSGDPNVEILTVSYDSRMVRPGALFAAVRGMKLDGRRYIQMAIDGGASAILTDAPLEGDPGVPVITVPDARSGMALAAAALHGHPAGAMTMIGITGTNGKTTTSFLLEAILNQAGISTGVIGTVNFRYGGREFPAPNTTPEGPDLQSILAGMRDAGTSHVIMEVSSHALSLSRVAGCGFDIAVFTNLSQDHLDFHEDMETYFQAKKSLFGPLLSGRRLPGGPKAIINRDDTWGRTLAADLGPKVLTFGLEDAADVHPVQMTADRKGLTARLKIPNEEFDIRSGLLGDVNMYNILAATASALALGIGPPLVVAGLAAASSVPGRLERVGGQDDFLALIDYAHTPDALERVLKVARELKPRRLITLFGCGGDRDKTKRPLMGRAVGRLSDLAIVTSDNPRTEPPLAIIEQIISGLTPLNLTRHEPADLNGNFPSGAYTALPDRREAIHLACRLLDRGDLLIVAGKGHEDYQILGRDKIHFDDREEVRKALKMAGKY